MLASYRRRCSWDLEAEKRTDQVRGARKDCSLLLTHLYRNFIGQAISGLPVTVFQLCLFLCLFFFLFRLSADAQGRVPGGRLPAGTTKSVLN